MRKLKPIIISFLGADYSVKSDGSHKTQFELIVKGSGLKGLEYLDCFNYGPNLVLCKGQAFTFREEDGEEVATCKATLARNTKVIKGAIMTESIRDGANLLSPVTLEHNVPFDIEAHLKRLLLVSAPEEKAEECRKRDEWELDNIQLSDNALYFDQATWEHGDPVLEQVATRITIPKANCQCHDVVVYGVPLKVGYGQNGAPRYKIGNIVLQGLVDDKITYSQDSALCIAVSQEVELINNRGQAFITEYDVHYPSRTLTLRGTGLKNLLGNSGIRIKSKSATYNGYFIHYSPKDLVFRPVLKGRDEVVTMKLRESVTHNKIRCHASENSPDVHLQTYLQGVKCPRTMILRSREDFTAKVHSVEFDGPNRTMIFTGTDLDQFLEYAAFSVGNKTFYNDSLFTDGTIDVSQDGTKMGYPVASHTSDTQGREFYSTAKRADASPEEVDKIDFKHTRHIEVDIEPIPVFHSVSATHDKKYRKRLFVHGKNLDHAGWGDKDVYVFRRGERLIILLTGGDIPTLYGGSSVARFFIENTTNAGPHTFMFTKGATDSKQNNVIFDCETNSVRLVDGDVNSEVKPFVIDHQGLTQRPSTVIDSLEIDRFKSRKAHHYIYGKDTLTFRGSNLDSYRPTHTLILKGASSGDDTIILGNYNIKYNNPEQVKAFATYHGKCKYGHIYLAEGTHPQDVTTFLQNNVNDPDLYKALPTMVYGEAKLQVSDVQLKKNIEEYGKLQSDRVDDGPMSTPDTIQWLTKLRVCSINIIIGLMERWEILTDFERLMLDNQRNMWLIQNNHLERIQ